MCGQGRGARACLLRCPMTHHDGQVGRHQRERVRLDGQRAEEMITPDEGSRRGSVSAVGINAANEVQRSCLGASRAVMYDMRGLCTGGLHPDCSPCSPALAGSGSVASGGAWRAGGMGLLPGGRPII